MNDNVLIFRYQEKTNSYYNLDVALTEEGEIEFNEGYYYPPQGDDEGQEYDYYLTIPATHFEEFVALLAAHCLEKEWHPQPDKELQLRELVAQLVVQGELGRSDTIRASLDTLQSWLDQAHIPYKQLFI
ncbi:MAG TPA: hypothetical protein VEL31_29285 [Ktedonobacteraceae bacterium]|nr:hypothetical protein [Ktedonobacteraceae bacterium]